MRRLELVAGLVALTVLGGACSDNSSSPKPVSSAPDGSIGGIAENTGELAWPLPPVDRVAPLTSAVGLELETHETLTFHVHAHLDVFIDGIHRRVPGGIGIVITDDRVHTDTFDGAPTYGGISPACLQPCISPLHTHDITGVIHTESQRSEPNTLGQFFTEWEVRLDDKCVGEFCAPTVPIAIYVNGKETPLASAAALPLTDQTEIAVVIGAKPSRIPSEGDFSAA